MKMRIKCKYLLFFQILKRTIPFFNILKGKKSCQIRKSTKTEKYKRDKSRCCPPPPFSLSLSSFPFLGAPYFCFKTVAWKYVYIHDAKELIGFSETVNSGASFSGTTVCRSEDISDICVHPTMIFS